MPETATSFIDDDEANDISGEHAVGEHVARVAARLDAAATPSTETSGASAPKQDSSQESGTFARSVDWSNNRVSAILEAAMGSFAERGVTGTTLADIGTELGVRKSMVHYYFASKTSLVHEVQSYASSRYMGIVRDSLGEATEEGHAEALSGIWSRLVAQPSVRGLNIEFWSEVRRDEQLAEQARSLRDDARALLSSKMLERKRLDEQKADDLAALQLAVMDGLTLLADQDGNTERATRALATFTELLKNCEN